MTNTDREFVPIIIGDTETPWSFAVTVPMKKIMEEANDILFYSIIIGIISLIAVLVGLYVVANRIFRPIEKTTLMLKEILYKMLNLQQMKYI